MSFHAMSWEPSDHDVTGGEHLSLQVRQYKHERECNAILHQSREDKIARLESLMDNVISTDAYLNEEWSALLLEYKVSDLPIV